MSYAFAAMNVLRHDAIPPRRERVTHVTSKQGSRPVMVAVGPEAGRVGSSVPGAVPGAVPAPIVRVGPVTGAAGS
jgi:hypothetical protein